MQTSHRISFESFYHLFSGIFATKVKIRYTYLQEYKFVNIEDIKMWLYTCKQWKIALKKCSLK